MSSGFTISEVKTAIKNWVNKGEGLDRAKRIQRVADQVRAVGAVSINGLKAAQVEPMADWYTAQPD